jgi:hypothetical protein
LSPAGASGGRRVIHAAEPGELVLLRHNRAVALAFL